RDIARDGGIGGDGSGGSSGSRCDGDARVVPRREKMKELRVDAMASAIAATQDDCGAATVVNWGLKEEHRAEVKRI
ncbi:hypothetical protein PIB30_105288, partial [Stylosanthes scabra]|nr:hypothetical protein [Stylosanthes scabra]